MWSWGLLQLKHFKNNNNNVTVILLPFKKQTKRRSDTNNKPAWPASVSVCVSCTNRNMINKVLEKEKRREGKGVAFVMRCNKR